MREFKKYSSVLQSFSICHRDTVSRVREKNIQTAQTWELKLVWKDMANLVILGVQPLGNSLCVYLSSQTILYRRHATSWQPLAASQRT